MTEDEMVGWHHQRSLSLSRLWRLVMDTLSRPGFLSANLSYTEALGDLHHLLARRPVNIFLLIKVNQPENLFSLKVIFLKFGSTPRKH